MTFQQFLENRVDEFCPECLGDVLICKVSKAILQSSYSAEFFCPRCFGIKVRRKLIVEKRKKISKAGTVIEQEEPKLVTLYSGGQLVLIDSNGLAEKAWACCCDAGAQFKKYKRYDPSFRNDTRCWLRIKDDHTAWLTARLKNWQNDSVKGIGFTPLSDVLKKSIPKPEEEFL
jgi:hypothetical protein